MTPQELRRQYRAARTIERADTMRDQLEHRARIAAAVLAQALADQPETTVPGYRVTRTAEGIHVSPLPAYDARQLALWRAMNEEPQQ